MTKRVNVVVINKRLGARKRIVNMMMTLIELTNAAGESGEVSERLIVGTSNVSAKILILSRINRLRYFIIN